MSAWALEVDRGSPSLAPAIVEVSECGIPDASGEARDANRQAWDRVIDQSLISWANGQIEIDDDLLSPTAASIRTAMRLSRRLRDAGATPPTDVLPSGDGGVLFENRVGQASEQIEVLRDGSAEISRYDERGFIDAVLHPATAFD